MGYGLIGHNILSSTDRTTYTLFFYNDCSVFTSVTHSASIVNSWISEVNHYRPQNSGRLIVGLEVESAGEQNQIALLQLCVGGRCLIYQISHSVGLPHLLDPFLSDPNNVFVGLGIKSNLDKLRTQYGIGGNATAVDLRDAASKMFNNRNRFRDANLTSLASVFLSREVEECLISGEWSNLPLKTEQVMSACIDAFLSYEIGRVLDQSAHLCL